MDRLSIRYRLGICAMALALAIGILSYLFLSYSVRKNLVSVETEAIVQAEDIKPASRQQIIAFGIAESTFAEFEKSLISEQGFLVENGLTVQIIYVKKVAAGVFNVRVRTADLNSWWKSTSLELAFFLILMSAIAGLVVFSLGSTITGPLKFLRKTADDINAGQFEITMEYKAEDEVGRLFHALKRLSVELEKKEIVIESVNSMAATDGLTGLKNHRAFKEEFRRQLSLAQRHGGTLGLIILDVDHFKKFNDQYGHLQGDEVLKFMGTILPPLVRDTDFVGRYGGEEFVAILQKPDEAGLVAVGEKIRKAIENTKVAAVTKGNPSLSVTVSLGAIFIDGKNLPARGELNVSDYIDAADKNMYIAKQQGRNRCVATKWTSAATTPAKS